MGEDLWTTEEEKLVLKTFCSKWSMRAQINHILYKAHGLFSYSPKIRVEGMDLTDKMTLGRACNTF